MKYAHSVFLNGKLYPRGVEIPCEVSLKAEEKDIKETEKPNEVENVVTEDKEVEEAKEKTPRKSAKRK